MTLRQRQTTLVPHTFDQGSMVASVHLVLPSPHVRPRQVRLGAIVVVVTAREDVRPMVARSVSGRHGPIAPESVSMDQ